MTTTAVSNELIELAHDLARAVSDHDVPRLEELLAAEFTLQGAAGQLDREEFLEAAAGPYEIDEFAYEQIDPEIYGNTAVLVSRYSQVATARRPRPDPPHARHGHLDAAGRTLADRPAPRDGGGLSLQQSVASGADRTREEVEAGMDAIRAAPRDEGVVELIVRRPAVDEREVVDEVALDLEDGVVGDNWSSRGRSGGRPANRDTQVTIMGARAVALAAGARERWPLAGDQLFVDLDLSTENLPPGTRLAIGTAVLEVTAEPHTGCKKFAQRFGLEALEAFNSDEGRALNLRGINTRVAEPGTVRVGDTVRKA